ncbi:hypothetical protein C8J57DRAFT_1612303 [Mycena rebaudengoi]|nr:hypothetical protein C8J57DRAFT_1612303 [Mycena rebaudengoi]
MSQLVLTHYLPVLYISLASYMATLSVPGPNLDVLRGDYPVRITGTANDVLSRVSYSTHPRPLASSSLSLSPPLLLRPPPVHPRLPSSLRPILLADLYPPPLVVLPPLR